MAISYVLFFLISYMNKAFVVAGPDPVRVFELLSFLGTLSLPFITVLAGAVAYQQLRESADARRIYVYLQIINLWNNNEFANSRSILRNFAHQHKVTGCDFFCQASDYIWLVLSRLSDSRNEADILFMLKAMKILELIEYIGLLCREKHLNIRHINDFLGSQLEQVAEDYMGTFIAYLRLKYQSESAFANILYLMKESKTARVAGAKFRISGFGCTRER